MNEESKKSFQEQVSRMFNIEKFEHGGNVDSYKVGDTITFFYGKDREEKSGLITDKTRDEKSFIVTVGSTQMKVKPEDVIGVVTLEKAKKKFLGVFKDGGNIDSEKLFDVKYVGKDRMKMKKSLRGSTSEFIKATSREEAIKKCKKENKNFGELVSVKEVKNVNPVFMEMYVAGGNLDVYKHGDKIKMFDNEPELEITEVHEWPDKPPTYDLKSADGKINRKNISVNKFNQIDTDKEIARLQSEIAQHDADIARYQENLKNSEANKNELVAKLNEHTAIENEDLMPWQKELTPDEIEFICSAINRYAETGHPNATLKNWKGFKYPYVKDILSKITDASHLSAEGIATKESIFQKLNIK